MARSCSHACASIANMRARARNFETSLCVRVLQSRIRLVLLLTSASRSWVCPVIRVAIASVHRSSCAAACVGFDLCHKYTLYLYLYLPRLRAHVMSNVQPDRSGDNIVLASCIEAMPIEAYDPAAHSRTARPRSLDATDGAAAAGDRGRAGGGSSCGGYDADPWSRAPPLRRPYSSEDAVDAADGQVKRMRTAPSEPPRAPPPAVTAGPASRAPPARVAGRPAQPSRTVVLQRQ